MTITVKAIPTTGGQLQPGDLFSTAGPEYWDKALDGRSIGERVFIRTNRPADVYSGADEPIFRIEIVREVERGGE